ncbi:hypothetical protein GW17_00008542 [Ensete ventricosum]|nr:hypothetical protein GW17_00008542 [Ensete ventricosum]
MVSRTLKVFAILLSISKCSLQSFGVCLQVGGLLLGCKPSALGPCPTSNLGFRHEVSHPTTSRTAPFINSVVTSSEAHNQVEGGRLDQRAFDRPPTSTSGRSDIVRTLTDSKLGVISIDDRPL